MEGIFDGGVSIPLSLTRRVLQPDCGLLPLVIDSLCVVADCHFIIILDMGLIVNAI